MGELYFGVCNSQDIPGDSSKEKENGESPIRQQCKLIGNVLNRDYLNWNAGNGYKPKLNHGDLKATQGDTGHAEIDMITRVYAHIFDEDRKLNAQKFESAFYGNPDLRSVCALEEAKP